MKKILLSLIFIICFSNAQMIRSDKQEILLDTKTNIMWQDNQQTKTITKTWHDAADYCKNLSLGGFEDWQLPDKENLAYLYKEKKKLINVADNIYWSSSSYSSYDSYSWGVYFSHGKQIGNSKTDSNYIRCIRSVKTPRIFDYEQFLGELKNYTIENKSVILNSSKLNESDEFVVIKNGKSYFGTVKNILSQLEIKVNFSKNPFVDIAKATQNDLDEYLSCAFIEKPNLVKNEFETIDEFKQRVQKAQMDYRAKVEKVNNELVMKEANITNKKNELLLENLALVLGEPIVSNPFFDAQTNTMQLNIHFSRANWSKKLKIQITDRQKAISFKDNVANLKSTVVFETMNDFFILKGIEIDGLEAKLGNEDLAPQPSLLASHKPIKLQNPNLIVPSLMILEKADNIKGAKNDDLFSLINKAKQKAISNKKWLFVVAIENYAEADNVLFVKNSAEAFIKASTKRFGIKKSNIYALIDKKASAKTIKDSLKEMLLKVKNGDSIYFYYSGHGVTNPSNGESYILPEDKIVDFVVEDNELKLQNIYKKLTDSKASKVVAFIESGFNGKTDGISNIKGKDTPNVINKKVVFDDKKMVIMTAASNNQSSQALFDKKHRLFSYHLIKVIMKNRKLSLDAIYKEVSSSVKNDSLNIAKSNIQEPQFCAYGYNK